MNLITGPVSTTLAALVILALVLVVFIPLYVVRNIANGRGLRVLRWLGILLPVIYGFLVIFSLATGEVSWMTWMWAALCIAYIFVARKLRTLKATTNN